MNTIQELRVAIRRLMSTPLYAAAMVSTLGLGIGANTAVFSIVDATISFASVAAVLTVVALMACWIPTRTAMRVHPTAALRTD